MKIHREDYGRFLFLGFCSGVGVCGSIFALLFIPATKYALMQPSIPVIATVISTCLGLERLNYLKVMGIGSAVGGAVLMELVGNSSSTVSETDMWNEIIGMTLAFGVCTCVASLVVFQKPILTKYSPALICAMYYGTGTCIVLSTYLLLCSLPFIFLMDPIVSFTYNDFYFEGSSVIFGCLMYGALIVTLFQYNAYTYASGLIAPSIVTTYSTILPAWTAAISFLVYNKSLSASEAMGGLLIAIGLVLSVRGGLVEQRTQAKSSLPHTVPRTPSDYGFEKFKN